MQSKKTVAVRDMMERYKSTACDERPCDCEMCRAIYGVKMPHRVSTCPWRNSSYARAQPSKVDWYAVVKAYNEWAEEAAEALRKSSSGYRYYAPRVEHGKTSKSEPRRTTGSVMADAIKAASDFQESLKFIEEVAPFTQADWDKAKSRLGGTWYGTDQRNTIKEAVADIVRHIDSKVDGLLAESAENALRKVLSAYSLTPDALGVTTNHQGRSSMLCPLGPGCPICGSGVPKSQGEQRMPPISPISSLADEIRRIGRDHNTDLSAISSAVKRAEDERKSLVVDTLRSMARLEKAKNRREGKEFVLAYQYAGDEYITHGTDFAYGKSIDKDDETDDYRVFLNEPEGIDNCYYTMPLMKEALKNTSYVVEYLD